MLGIEVIFHTKKCSILQYWFIILICLEKTGSNNLEKRRFKKHLKIKSNKEEIYESQKYDNVSNYQLGMLTFQ